MPSIGETLREARMHQGLDIADVEARTKIRAKYLRALENEEFSMLPGPTFVKTFLRTYAELLGLDPHALVEEYRASYEQRDELDLQPLGSASRVRSRERRRPAGRRRPPPGLLVALGLVAILAVLLVLGLAGGDDDGGGGDQADQPDATTTETSQRRRQRPEAPPPPPDDVTLRIVPVDATYVCIDSGAGTPVLFEGIIDGPERWRGDTLRLNLGKTSAEVRSNGKRVPVEPGPDPVGFELSPDSTEPLPSGERPCA